MKIVSIEFLRKWRREIHISQLAELGGIKEGTIRRKLKEGGRLWLEEGERLGEILEKDGVYVRDRVSVDQLQRMQTVKGLSILRRAGLDKKKWKIYQNASFSVEEEKAIARVISTIAKDID